MLSSPPRRFAYEDLDVFRRRPLAVALTPAASLKRPNKGRGGGPALQPPAPQFPADFSRTNWFFRRGYSEKIRISTILAGKINFALFAGWRIR